MRIPMLPIAVRPRGGRKWLTHTAGRALADRRKAEAHTWEEKRRRALQILIAVG